jgi:5-oxoprolinase (ATP-hydrolysing)
MLLGVPRGRQLPTELIAKRQDGHDRRHQRAARAQRAIACCCWSSEGFRDALEIGYQARPKIFARESRSRRCSMRGVAEVPERVRADGTMRDAARHCRHASPRSSARAWTGIDCVAIVFMHAYAYPSTSERLRASATSWLHARSRRAMR